MSQKNHFASHLSGILETKNSRNTSYSLRAFARDLQVDPSDLCRFLKGKSYPGMQGLVRIVGALDRIGEDVDQVLLAISHDLKSRARDIN